MEIPNGWAPLLVSAVRDAVLYQEQLVHQIVVVSQFDTHLLLLSFLICWF